MTPHAATLAGHVATCLHQAEAPSLPFPHWLLCDVLPEPDAEAIANLPIAAPEIGDSMGKRETHNDFRRFFSADIQAQFPACAAVAEAFQDRATVRLLSETTNTELTGASLRIEYCQDRAGFWLEPHTDIGAKLFTMLVYLSDDPSLGTDIYDADKRHLGQAPGGFNCGLIFIPGANTWHGVERRDIGGIRRSIIINYVKPEWRARGELCYPETPVQA